MLNEQIRFTNYLGVIFYKIINEKNAIQVNIGSFPEISLTTKEVALNDLSGKHLTPNSEKDFKIAYNKVRQELHTLAMGEPMTSPHAVAAITPKNTP